jgi:hypothetical protein
MSGQGAPQRWDVEPFTELKTTVAHVGEPLDTVPAVASAAAPRCISSATSLFLPSWHGAAQTRFMPHLAMLEVDDEGNSATWGDHVRDEEYEAAPRIDNGQPM